MKVLVVASYNKGRFAPFIVEQMTAIGTQGNTIEFFGIEGKGLKGYFGNIWELKRRIKDFEPDVIHAHYGLSGLLANMQRKVPVVTTYHGSDINNPKALRFSKICMRLSKFNIFVSTKNAERSSLRRDYIVQPCGIDLDNFSERTKQDAREALGWDMDGKFVIFAGAFDNHVKNALLAKEAIALLEDVHLAEMKGYSRKDVANVLFAADALLMTSFTEGSPQVVKEALACGCPVVSVDVGDVKEMTSCVDGCFVSERNAEALALEIRKALAFEGRTKGRERILKLGLTNDIVAKRIVEIYQEIVLPRN